MAATMEILEYYFKIKNNEKVVKKEKTKISLKKTFKRLFRYVLFSDWFNILYINLIKKTELY